MIDNPVTQVYRVFQHHSTERGSYRIEVVIVGKTFRIQCGWNTPGSGTWHDTLTLELEGLPTQNLADVNKLVSQIPANVQMAMTALIINACSVYQFLNSSGDSDGS